MNNGQKKEMEEKLYRTDLGCGKITEVVFWEKEKEPYSDEGIAMREIPARCNISVTLKPAAESDIKMVISLPVENWNGRYLGTGNGGAAGTIVKQSLDAGAARGFATANTDLGTVADAEKMNTQRERWKDFGHRATHLMTLTAKKLIYAFYGRDAEKSYFVGGSTGGQQALREAQRYPEDYDGIIAFSPAYNRVNLHQKFIWEMYITSGERLGIFQSEQIAAVKDRVLERFVKVCGGAPGDDFLSYPGKAGFTADDVDSVFAGLGLSDKQMEVLKGIYSVPKIPMTESGIYYPQALGCESAVLSLSYLYRDLFQMLCFLHQWAFGKEFDCAEYDFEKDYIKMAEMMNDDFNAVEPDLTAFKERGGKMILITGSTDCLIPYTDGKRYYENVIKAIGGIEKTTDFFRYFHIPGLGHCTGGRGIQEIGNLLGIKSIPLDAEHDVLEALIAWAENGEAPEELLPVGFQDEDMKGVVDMERPVYPYPYETEYIGGDRKKKESFRRKLGDGVY